jgi:hypothetical protein
MGKSAKGWVRPARTLYEIEMKAGESVVLRAK